MPRKVTELQVGAKTDTGRKRDHNEDQFAIVEQYKEKAHWPLAEKKGNLFIVADGMGGHNAGEVASRLAVDIIARQYYGDDSPDVESSLRQSIEEANRQVYQRAQEVRAEAGMGSTIVAAVIRGDEIFVAHAGDSRAYRVRRGQLEPLTQDHSWVSEQLARNLITPEQARNHPYRNYITRSLGIKPELEVDTNHWTIEPGDVYLLCSDGLSGPVEDETMRDVVSQWEPADACEDLVRRANEAGGPDNITAVVIRVGRVVPTAPAYRVGALARTPEADAVPESRKTTELLPVTQARAAQRIPEDGRPRTIPWLAGMALAIVAALALGAAACFYLQNQDLSAQIRSMGATLTASLGEASPEISPTSVPPTETTVPEDVATQPLVAPVSSDTPTASTTPSAAPPTDTPVPPTVTDTPTTSPPTETPTSTPTLTPTGSPLPTLEPQPAHVSAALGANLRSEPIENDNILAGLPRDTRLKALGRTEAADWVRVRVDGGQGFGPDLVGWVAAELIRFENPNRAVEDLPVVPVAPP